MPDHADKIAEAIKRHERWDDDADVTDVAAIIREHTAPLVEALRDAIEGYADCVMYKIEYVRDKHKDQQHIERLRSVLSNIIMAELRREM